MAKAMDLLRKLRFTRTETSETGPASKAEPETAFDRRLKKMGGVRQVNVSRAILFRTQPAQMEA